MSHNNVPCNTYAYSMRTKQAQSHNDDDNIAVCALLTISVRPACTLGVLSALNAMTNARTAQASSCTQHSACRKRATCFSLERRCSTIHNYNSSSTTKSWQLARVPQEKSWSGWTRAMAIRPFHRVSTHGYKLLHSQMRKECLTPRACPHRR